MAELTGEQIAELAREAQIAFCLDKYPSFEVAIARKVEAACNMAEWGGRAPLPPALEWMVALALKHIIEDWLAPDENVAAWKAWARRLVNDPSKIEALCEESILKSISDVLAFLDAARNQSKTEAVTGTKEKQK